MWKKIKTTPLFILSKVYRIAQELKKLAINEVLPNTYEHGILGRLRDWIGLAVVLSKHVHRPEQIYKVAGCQATPVVVSSSQNWAD